MTHLAEIDTKPVFASWQTPFIGAFTELNTIEPNDMGRVYAVLKNIHKSVEGRAPYSMTSLYYAAMYPDNSALSSIGGAVAGHIDQAVHAPHQGNGYHNTMHLKKVFINAVVLCALHDKLAIQDRNLPRLSDSAKRVLYIAAMAHDIDHDGGSNKVDGVRVDFRLEDIAADKVDAVLNAFGQADELKQAVRGIIRATDLGAPHQVSLEMQDPEKKLITQILCDADLMSSTCIRPSASYAETLRLSQEFGAAISSDGFKHFTDKLVTAGYESPSGKLFNDKMQWVVSETLRLLQKHPIRLQKKSQTTRNCLKHTL